MSGSGSNEQQHPKPNHAIQLKFTTDDPDKPIARKITYNALPVWRHLLKKVEKLFGINSESIQIIYPLDDGNQIIINSDYDLQAVLASASATDHIFKFVVQNMHSPKTAFKIIGRPTHNRLSSPKKFHMDFMRSFDAKIPPINEPPPNILNYKPRKYRLFPLNGGGAHDEDYLKKNASQYNSVPFAVPLETPSMVSYIEWPKEVPDRVTDMAVLPPPALAGPRRSSITSPHTVKPAQPIKPMPSPVNDPVEGLSLDLGPPAETNQPSALGIQLNGSEDAPPSSPAARPTFNSPVSHRTFTANPSSTSIFSGFSVPPDIQHLMLPPPASASAQAADTLQAPRISTSPVNETETTNSLGLGLNLPLGMILPIPNTSFTPPINFNLSNNLANSSSNSIVSREPTIPSSSPPPGIIPFPQPHPSPAGTIIDDTSDMQKPSMLLSPLHLPGEITEPQSRNAKRFRRRPGEIIVIEETSVSSSGSVRGHVGGLETILRNGYGSASASEAQISPPLGSAAVHRYMDYDESDNSTERSQRRPASKMRTETPPIVSSARSKLGGPSISPAAGKTVGRRKTSEVAAKKAPSLSSSSESPPLPSNRILLERRRKRFTPSPSRIRRPAAPVASTLSLASKISKAKLSLVQQQPPIPQEIGNPGSFSSSSTKRAVNSPVDHAVPATAEPVTVAPPPGGSGASLISEPTLQTLKSEIGEIIKNEMKEGIKQAIEELKTELQRSLTEALEAHRNELREQLEQADRQPSERSRAYSQERPPYSASVIAPPPPFMSQSIPSSAPPPHSYHPYMSLPTSSLIFPPHHPYCGDYTFPTPSFSVPYHSYAMPTTSGLPMYTCCRGHPTMKPPETSLSSSHYHTHYPPPPPPPPPPPAAAAPPPPPPPPPPPVARSYSRNPSIHRQPRWPFPDHVSAAPAYSGSETSLPRPGNVNGTHHEYNEGLARLRDIEERLKILLEGKNGGRVGQQERPQGQQHSMSAPTLASSSVAPNPQRTRKHSDSSTYSVGEYYLIHC